MSTALPYMSLEANEWGFVRIQIRIHLPHSIACRKRQLNGMGVWIRRKTWGQVWELVKHDKYPPLLINYNRLNFAALHRRIFTRGLRVCGVTWMTAPHSFVSYNYVQCTTCEVPWSTHMGYMPRTRKYYDIHKIQGP
jgi:hypothetical protein